MWKGHLYRWDREETLSEGEKEDSCRENEEEERERMGLTAEIDGNKVPIRRM